MLEARERRRLFGALAPMVPSVEAMYDGPAGLAEFKSNGEEFLRILRDVCDLRPDERMLDVGSGIGRKTIPLTQYLDANATYEGIDVNANGVAWCREKITSRFSNFRFQQIDVHNALYNPQGTGSPADYRFPFPDRSFTFVLLGSVFTHMRPAEVEHYLGEIARVLASDGRCLISYFLLNDFSRHTHGSLEFGQEHDGWATISEEIPERAIALDEALVRDLYQRAGLEIVRVDYGSWCGRAGAVSYQDLIVARRAPDSALPSS